MNGSWEWTVCSGQEVRETGARMRFLVYLPFWGHSLLTLVPARCAATSTALRIIYLTYHQH